MSLFLAGVAAKEIVRKNIADDTYGSKVCAVGLKHTVRSLYEGVGVLAVVHSLFQGFSVVAVLQ